MAKSSALWDAILAGDLSAVEDVIRGGADIHDAEVDGWPPLHLAIEHQQIQIIQRLVASGADVNGSTIGGSTPLVHAIDIACDSAWQKHWEVGHEATELVELLLSLGARPTDEAFEIAKDYGSDRTLQLLHGRRTEA